MRVATLIIAALGACLGCSGDDGADGGATGVTDGGDAAAAGSGSGGAAGSAGGSSSGGALAAGGGSASGGAGGAGGAAAGAGGAPKPCPLDTTPCTSCLGPKCPDAIQACGTSASCLESLTVLASCVCPTTPNGKTADECLLGVASRGALEASFATCIQTASACRSLCGL